MTALADIDRTLDALGTPPASLAELLARYGEADRGLDRIDAALDALGIGTNEFRASVVRTSVDVARVGGEGDALPAALGEEIEVEVSRSEPPPAIAADPLAAPRWTPPRVPDPKVRARFEALFEEQAPERGSVASRGSVRPRPELDELLDQEIDPNEFPRAGGSARPPVVVEDADSSMEMLVDDDDLLEVDDADLEEIE